MTLTPFEDRKEYVMKIADDMAAAASSMNPQNYDTLITCRNELQKQLDVWAKEDTTRHTLINHIKEELETFETNL